MKVKILFKKSYRLNNLSKITYDNLWNTKGVFTTIRIQGSPPKIFFLKEHLDNLNKSLKKLNINFSINSQIFKSIVIKELKKHVKYNHLLRIAINRRVISINLRQRKNPNKFLKASIFKYQRPQPHIKNLYYNKILSILRSIDTSTNEIILFYNKKLLEGCTTNIICAKNSKLYIPKENYYYGITLQLIAKFTKRKIIKKNILIKQLNFFDEIILVGSGKGVVAVNNIPQIKWKNKTQIIYKELQQLYKSILERKK